jgi:hypothetical protein
MALVKAEILRRDKPEERFTVLFNPEEYTISQDNTFASQAIPGLSAPLLQFVSGNMRTLDMELFFDTYDNSIRPKQDVREITNRFLKLMEIDAALHVPPILCLSWASLQFDCVLASASQKFIMFWDDGTPVRARLTVKFNEYVDPEREGKKISRQTADFTKVHVDSGPDLIGLAAKFTQPAKMAADRDRQWSR